MDTIASPGVILAKQTLHPEELTTLLAAQVERVHNALKHIDTELSKTVLFTLGQYIYEHTGVHLNIDQMRQFTSLFPELRAHIILRTPDAEPFVMREEDAELDGLGDRVFNCLCQMLVGCDYNYNPKLTIVMQDQVAKVWPTGEQNG